jgi:hypothetical protein
MPTRNENSAARDETVLLGGGALCFQPHHRTGGADLVDLSQALVNNHVSRQVMA